MKGIQIQKRQRKILALILACVMLLSTVVVTGVVFKKSKADISNGVEINILHTNDIHGDGTNMAYIAKYKQETKNAILVDGGDATQGKSLATYTKGNALIQLMNKSGYDLSIFGNHEFDYGMEQLLKNVEAADFSFLAANVRKTNGDLLLKTEEENGGYKIIEKAGKKIGFFGISTTETAYKTNPDNVKDVTFEPEIESAQKVADELNDLGCDLVVGLMHVGIDKESDPKGTDMAEQLEGVDLLIDGHSHSDVEYTAKNGTLLVQAGTQIKKLGKVTVTFTDDGKELKPQLLTSEQFTEYGKDDEVDKLHEKLLKDIEPMQNTVIGNTKDDIIANKETENGKVIRIVRNQETPIGDMITDAMVKESSEILKNTQYKDLPVVALTNGGGIRDNIPAGDITNGQVFSTLPYGMYVKIVVATPDVLYKAMESGIACLELDENKEVTGFSGGFPQISGMRFEMDLSKKSFENDVCDGERVVALYIKNADGTETKLDRNDKTTKIALAANNFICAGGDGYTMLEGLETIGEGNTLDEILGDYIADLTEAGGGSFSYKFDGTRSVIVNK